MITEYRSISAIAAGLKHTASSPRGTATPALPMPPMRVLGSSCSDWPIRRPPLLCAHAPLGLRCSRRLEAGGADVGIGHHVGSLREAAGGRHGGPRFGADAPEHEAVGRIQRAQEAQAIDVVLMGYRAEGVDRHEPGGAGEAGVGARV